MSQRNLCLIDGLHAFLKTLNDIIQRRLEWRVFPVLYETYSHH